MNRLCFNQDIATVLTKGKGTILVTRWFFAIIGGQYTKEHFRQDIMEAAIRFRKEHELNFESSLAWAISGYNNWPYGGTVPTVVDRWSRCPRCMVPRCVAKPTIASALVLNGDAPAAALYTTPFTGHWSGLGAGVIK